MNEILTIAAGAVEGFGTVYSGLEESAKILGKNLGENSVKIIEHKYYQYYNFFFLICIFEFKNQQQ